MTAGERSQPLDTPLEESIPDAAGRRVLGLRLSALMEMALFLGGLWVVDRAFLAGDAFWTTAPHPFWILVLLVSVQYGTSEGILAAMAASAVLLGSHAPVQGLEQDFYDWVFELSQRPLMWLVAAVVAGELRSRQLRTQRETEAELAAIQEREQLLSESYERVSRLKDDLEARVAGQMRTVVSMYEAARSMEHLDPGEVERGIMRTVGEAMGPEKYSLFLVEGEVLRQSLAEGWETGDPFSRSLTPSTGLFQEVVGGRRVLTVSRAEDEALMQGEGMLAGPLVSEDTDEVVGMLKIESLGFLGLSVTAVRNFEVLCAWVGTVYGNARRYQSARQTSYVSERGNLFSASFFERQLQFLTGLARRQNFDLTQVDVALANYEELPRETRGLAPEALSEAVGSVLRRTDLAFDHRNNGREFAIILPATPPENADLVVDKLLTDLRERLAGQLEEARWQTGVKALYRVSGDGNGG